MVGPRNPAIESLPAYSGSTFVGAENLNNEIPDYLEPSKQLLPSPFVVVITGASRGIGKGIAKAFAAAGATGIILTARTAASLEDARQECTSVAKSKDLRFSLLSADNAAESSAKLVAETIRKEHSGRLDLLVNNAGILNTDPTAFGKFADIESPNIEVPINVNYLGRFYMIKHLMPLLRATKSGAQAIVNISSLGSHISGPLGYSISALATNRMVQRVAESHGEEGIVCFAVHPGAVMPEVPPPGMPPSMADFSITNPGLAGAWLVWLVREKREWLSGRYMDVTWDPVALEEKKEEIVAGDKLKMRMVV